MIITGSGNVGVGTTNPLGLLDVNQKLTVLSAGNVGIGTTNPATLFSIGNNSPFQVDSSGNMLKINNVAYSWPTVQGTANQVLQNNGAGTLTWGTINNNWTSWN